MKVLHTYPRHALWSIFGVSKSTNSSPDVLLRKKRMDGVIAGMSSTISLPRIISCTSAVPSFSLDVMSKFDASEKRMLAGAGQLFDELIALASLAVKGRKSSISHQVWFSPCVTALFLLQLSGMANCSAHCFYYRWAEDYGWTRCVYYSPLSVRWRWHFRKLGVPRLGTMFTERFLFNRHTSLSFETRSVHVTGVFFFFFQFWVRWHCTSFFYGRGSDT